MCVCNVLIALMQVWQDIHLTENGVNGATQRSRQATMVCEALRGVLDTAGINDFIYHRAQDHPAEGGLQVC